MLLDLLWQIVGERWLNEVKDDDNPVIKNGSVLCEESINPVFTSTKLLHDEQVMQFIPSLGPVNT